MYLCKYLHFSKKRIKIQENLVKFTICKNTNHMKSYSYNNIPETKNVKIEGDIRSEMPVNLLTFLKDTLWNNMFEYPVANILYILLIAAGLYKGIFEGDIDRMIWYIAIVLLLKGRLIYYLVKMHRSFRKAGIFPVITEEGISHMTTFHQGAKSYVRMSTIKWADVKKVRFYKNFAAVEIQKIDLSKYDIPSAYIWSDDIPELRDQILCLWNKALAAHEDQEEKLTIYSEKDEAEVNEFISGEFGEFTHVFHEVASADLHIDIAMIPPQEGRNYYTLCTIGAGAYRMNIQDEVRVGNMLSEYSEYMICLPADWKLDQESLKDEENYWPVRLLKSTARMPIWSGSWLGAGHTIGNEEGKAYSEKYPFNNILLLHPIQYLTRTRTNCNLTSGKTIAFHQILPISQEELEMIKEKGTAEFMTSIIPEDCTVMESIINRLKD